MRVFATGSRHLGWVVAGVYLLITLWMTWPLPRYVDSAVQDPGDPLMQIWVMRSIQHQLANDPLDLYQGTAFYPFEHSLAYSEEAISTALLAWPVYLLSGNDILAYNVLFLGSFWLMAFAVYLLARELGAVPGAAFVAGLAAAFAPARFGHVSHLNMLVLGWLPLALWAVTRYVRGGGRRYALLAGIALAIQLLASLHLTVFSSLALGIYLLFLLACERDRRAWSRADLGVLAAALVLPYLLFAPTLLPHLRVGDEYGFTRSTAEVDALAAVPRSYISVFVANDFWPRWLDVRAEPFFPGLVALGGAALAALWFRRWAVAFAALLALVAGVFSLGLHIDIAGSSLPLPYGLVYDLLPPVRAIRGVGRFGLLTAIAIPLLAALGYSAAWGWLRPRVGQFATAAGLALTALLALVVCVELRGGVGARDVEASTGSLAVYDWLADQPPGPVAEFPADGLLYGTISPPGGVFQPIRYMYASTRHWNPVLAGYSSYVPEAYWQLIAQFMGRDGNPSMVTPANVGLLQDIGIRWILIHRRDDFDWQRAVATAGALPELRQVADLGDCVVYEVERGDRAPLPAAFGALTTSGQAYAGSYVEVRADLHNPYDNLALAHLEREPEATITWTRPDGSIAKEDRLPLPIPVALPPGDSSIALPAIAPSEPGTYVARVSVSGDLLPAVERQVEVAPLLGASGPLLALEAIEWDRATPLRPGDLLHVDVTWHVLADVPADFAATVQILDGAGERRSHADLLPGGEMPPTSAWRAGQRVTLGFNLHVDPSLPAGDYRLLTAIYAYLPGYPRVPLRLPDGSVATELVIDGLILGS